MISLTGYQKEDLNKIEESYRRGVNRQLLFWSMGLGKTAIASHLPKKFPELVKRQGMLFLCHRREIIKDTLARFENLYPDLYIGLEMGERTCSGYEDICIVSVQSITGRYSEMRMRKLERRKFGIVVTDEGHHATVDGMYAEILDKLGVGPNPANHYKLPTGRKPLSLFLTATPNRNDGRGLHPFVDEVVASRSMVWGVKNGYLVDIRAFQLTRDEEIDIPYLIKAYSDYLQGRKTIVFAASVEQSQQLVQAMGETGVVSARHIDAKTKTEDRDEYIADFRSGKVEILSNRWIINEGFDSPTADAILDNAPTESKPLALQKIGRILRPHPQANVYELDTVEERLAAIAASPKPYGLYISTGDPTRHGLNVIANLLGTRDNFDSEGMLFVNEIVDLLGEDEPEDADPIDAAGFEQLKTKLKEADIWKQRVYDEEIKHVSDLRWIRRRGGYALYLRGNPFVRQFGNTYKTVDTVVEYREVQGGYELHAHSGGWNGRFPAKNKSVHLGLVGQVSHGISQLDEHLKKNHPNLHILAANGNGGEPHRDVVRYLKDKGLSVSGQMTERDALRAKDLYRIDNKINKSNEQN